MTLSPGDPLATSALGGTLVTQAAGLADLLGELEQAARGSDADPTHHERQLLLRVATELDAVGRLLQAWTTTAAEAAARVRALDGELGRHDLVVDGHLVVERPGPSGADPRARLRERERLQERLNRVTAVRSRELAHLRRELESSTARLAALSARARTGA